MISIVIQDEDRRILRIQAIGNNGAQYQVREERHIAGRCVAVKEHGLIGREKGEDDKKFALKLLQRAVEK